MCVPLNRAAYLAVFQMALSLDHLVGTQQNRDRDRDTDRLGSFQVNAELEFGGLLNRKVSGFRSFKDLVDVARGAPKHVRAARAIGQQRTGFRKAKRRRGKYRRQSMLEGGLDDADSVCKDEAFDRRNQERARLLFDRPLDGAFEVGSLAS